MIQGILERRAHPQQGFCSALGILRLGKGFGHERLEAASAVGEGTHDRCIDLQVHEVLHREGFREGGSEYRA